MHQNQWIFTDSQETNKGVSVFRPLMLQHLWMFFVLHATKQKSQCFWISDAPRPIVFEVCPLKKQSCQCKVLQDKN